STPSPPPRCSTPSATTPRPSTPRASPPPPASIDWRRWPLVDLAKIRKKARTPKASSEPLAASSEPLAASSEPAPERESTQSSVLSPQSSPKLERFMAEAGKRREGFVQGVAEAAAASEIE